MDSEAFRERIAPYHGRITIDIGTGDGLFVYNSARSNPDRFFIGLDANRRPLQKISEKIHRKISRGGLPNVIYVQAAVESLPAELDGVADEIYVNFPWGSLLRAVAGGDEVVLASLRRISAPHARLRVLFTIDPERDRYEIKRLGLPLVDRHYLDAVLPEKYAAARFAIVDAETLAAIPAELQTSWARRLTTSSKRQLFQIVAIVMD